MKPNYTNPINQKHFNSDNQFVFNKNTCIPSCVSHAQNTCNQKVCSRRDDSSFSKCTCSAGSSEVSRCNRIPRGRGLSSYSLTAYPAGFVKSREINLKSFLVLPKINSLSSLSVLFTVPSWVCPHVEVFQVAQITNVNRA